MYSRPPSRRAKVAARSAIAVAAEEEKQSLRKFLRGEPKLSPGKRESSTSDSLGGAGLKRGTGKEPGLRRRMLTRKDLDEKRGTLSPKGNWHLRRSPRRKLGDLTGEVDVTKEEEKSKIIDLVKRGIGLMPDGSTVRRLKEEYSDVEMNDDGLERTDGVQRLARMRRSARMGRGRDITVLRVGRRREYKDNLKKDEREEEPGWRVGDGSVGYAGQEERGSGFLEEACKRRDRNDAISDQEEGEEVVQEQELVESGVEPRGRMDAADDNECRDAESSLGTKLISRETAETREEGLRNARSERSTDIVLKTSQAGNSEREHLGKWRRTRAVRGRIRKIRRRSSWGARETVAPGAFSDARGGSSNLESMKANRHSQSAYFACETPRRSTRTKGITQRFGHEEEAKSQADKSADVKKVKSPTGESKRVRKKSKALDAERSTPRQGRDPRFRLRIREGTLGAQQHKFCEGVVKDLLRREDAKPFSEPIHKLWSVDQLPGYFDIIKTPMDLGTVLQNLESGEYRRKDSGDFDLAFFSADVRTVFLNSLTYNEADTEFYKAARVLLDDFEDAMRQLPTAESSGGSKGGGEESRKTNVPGANEVASDGGSVIANLEKRAKENELKYLKVKRDYIRDRAGELAVSRENYLCHWEKLKIRDAIASVYNDEEKMKAIIRIIRRQVFDALRGIRKGNVLPEYVDIDIDEISPYACREIFDICTPDRRDNLLRLKAELKETDENIQKLEDELKNFGTVAT